MHRLTCTVHLQTPHSFDVRKNKRVHLGRNSLLSPFEVFIHFSICSAVKRSFSSILPPISNRSHSFGCHFLPSWFEVFRLDSFLTARISFCVVWYLFRNRTHSFPCKIVSSCPVFQPCILILAPLGMKKNFFFLSEFRYFLLVFIFVMLQKAILSTFGTFWGQVSFLAVLNSVLFVRYHFFPSKLNPKQTVGTVT